MAKDIVSTQSRVGVVEGAQEGSQTHSEPGGVVEGARRTAKCTQSLEEWWRGPGVQPNTLRAGRSGGGLHHYDIITVSEP